MFDAAPAALSHDQLVATPVAYFRDEAVSFAEMLRHYAHVEGGVHITSPTDELSKTLVTMSGILHDTESHFVDVLRPMGRAVAAGLAPLVAALDERAGLPRP